MPNIRSKVNEVIRTLPAELARRTTESLPLEVFVVPADVDLRQVLGGSMCILAGPAGAGLVAKVRAAARGGRWSEVSDAIAEHVRAITGKRRPVADDVPAALSRVETFVDVHYGGAGLASALPLLGSGSEARILVPFAGGQVDKTKFSARGHIAKGRATAAATVVLVHPPAKSDFEIRVSEFLPPQLRGGASGTPMAASELAVAAAIIAVIVVGVAAALYFLNEVDKGLAEYAEEGEAAAGKEPQDPEPDEPEEPTTPDSRRSRIGELPVDASVAALLAMREELLRNGLLT
jgi:hypothetical protein